jgi:hypothetical protein
MPITNIVIVLFILAMIYMGTVQGLFSSFLHLMVVIAAGTLAFALWEPLTLGLLIKYVPVLAWTLGLLVPFGLLLLILRMVVDKFVPANAQFPGMANVLLGGGCGMLSGMLTAGVAVIGIGFLPFGPDLGGYQPYSVAAGGVIQQTGGKLWVPVNSIAANFYSGLSRGAFATKTPLAEYKPHLDVQMSLGRVRPDFVSIVAAPKAVEVTGAYMADVATLTDASPAIATALGPKFAQPGTKLVIVDTEWSTVQNTVDGDRALRLPSAHVRLITKSTDPGSRDVEMVGPVGFAKPQGDDGRVFYPYDSESTMAFSTAPSSTFAWVFLLPDDQEPLFPQVRSLRLDMPDADKIETKSAELLAALGNPLVVEPEDEDDEDDADERDEPRGATAIGDRTGIRAGTYVLNLNITDRLPLTASRNSISGLSIGDGTKGAVVQSGSKGSARKPTQSIGSRNKVIGFDVPSHEAMVQVKVTSDQNTSLFGAGLSSAAALNPMFLEDSQGNKWFVTAWVWKKENKDQEIFYDAFNPIRSAKQMPISQMNKGDEFYLYFTVTKPATLTRYSIGDVSSQDFEPPLEVK